MIVVDFKKRKEKKKIRRKRRQWRWCIESWTRIIIAQKDLVCYRCGSIWPIFAGDQCVREVWAYCGGDLEVRHAHYGLCPEDPPWEKEKQEENKLRNAA